MKPIDLDFCAPRMRFASRSGFILLMAALLLGAYLVHMYSQYRTQQESLKSELERLHRKQGGSAIAVDNKELEPALQRASVVIDRIGFPWDKLFKTLESSTVGEDVALLSIQPDMAGGTVTLNAEAKDWNAMLSYIRHLGKEGFFTDVHLASHQIQQADPQKPVRFVLSCTWTGFQAR